MSLAFQRIGLRATATAGRWLVAGCLLMLIGCQGDSQGAISEPPPAPPANNIPALPFPQLKPVPEPRPFMLALATGRLVLEDGCIRLLSDRSTESSLIIWPEYVHLDSDNQAMLVVDTHSQKTAAIGQRVQMGGGTIPFLSVSFRQELKAPIPAECTGPYFVTSGISKVF